MTRLHCPRFWLAVLGMLALALGLAACGRKGPLEPPPAALTEPVTAGPGPAAPQNNPPKPAPAKQPFILDGLL